MTPCSCGPHLHLPPTALPPACLECPCEQLRDTRVSMCKPPTRAECRDAPLAALRHEMYHGPNQGLAS